MVAGSDCSTRRPDTEAQDQSLPLFRFSLQRTAGPYIRVKMRRTQRELAPLSGPRRGVPRLRRRANAQSRCAPGPLRGSPRHACFTVSLDSRNTFRAKQRPLKRRDYKNKISVDDVAFSVYILVCIKSRGLRPRQPAGIPKGDAATSATKPVARECQPSSDQTGGGFFDLERRTRRARGIWFQIASPCRSQNWLKRSLP